MTFYDLQFQHRSPYTGNQQAIAEFPNGYVASVIRGPWTYGGDRGLYELAVMRDGVVVYDTPITDDVIGYLQPDDVTRLLADIAALPEK